MSPDRGVSRRHLLGGVPPAGIGAGAIGFGLGSAAVPAAVNPPGSAAPPTIGAATVAFFGRRQAGIEVPAQAHISYLAFDLADHVDQLALRRLMVLLTDDAARLARGEPALADTEPELAVTPARLTVTFGFGAGLVARTSAPPPGWLRPLPAFGVDRLDPAYCDGDLLLAIASDDPVTVSHCARMLLKDARAFATPRWVQSGFHRAAGSEATGTTMRNLFGQVDGSANPRPGSADLEEVLWRHGDNPSWLRNGTGLVLRRIEMDLDKWDALDRSSRESAIGRTLSNGAPLTGSDEMDDPDFSARNAIGLPVIPEVSHLRRARMDDPRQRIFRRGYNFEEPTGSGGTHAGLLFGSYQADVDAQFVPIQRRLDALDLLNQWTTPVGSAVFAIPPGCEEGSYVGHSLF
ncbi:Dyp-type peroxidase [soil metagenome]